MTSRSILTFPMSSSSIRARSRCSRTCRPGAARKPTTSPMCSIISMNWWSRKSTAPAAMACWSGRPRRKRRSRNSAPSSRRGPSNYIAQPTLALSATPTFTASGVAPRHVDLRPFVLSGDRIRITPRRAHARRAQERIARRQFEPGRRHQRYLGAGGLAMLGRTAASLFWMSRYVERAENMARLLEVGYRISLMPGAIEGHRDEWRSTLDECGLRGELFQEARGRHDDQGDPSSTFRRRQFLERQVEHQGGAQQRPRGAHRA